MQLVARCPRDAGRVRGFRVERTEGRDDAMEPGAPEFEVLDGRWSLKDEQRPDLAEHDRAPGTGTAGPTRCPVPSNSWAWLGCP